MFDFIVILVLVALAFPVIAIVALAKTMSLRTLIVALGERVETLERDLARRDVVSPQITTTTVQPEPAPAPPPLPVTAPPEAQASAAAPPSSSVPLVPEPSASPPPLPRSIGFEER